MPGFTRRAAIAAGASLALLPAEAAGAGDARALVRRLRDHCDRLVTEDGFNGVVLLKKDGRTLFHHAYGLRNRSDQLPNTVQTKFNIASVGKMFTSLSIMRFAQNGRLRLDGRLIDAWPDYPDRAVAERITLEQILTHTAGLGNHVMFKPKTGLNAASSQTDYLQLFADEGLAGEPGVPAYSNDGYALLGALIERLSGKDYKEHCRETIFAPLGMNNTGFAAPDDIVSNLATPYARDLARPGIWRAALATDGLSGGAFGGGFSTAGDLAHFGAAISANQLLAPELTRAWTMARVPFRNDQYGFGVQIENINGCRVYGHTGGHYGVAAEMMIFEGLGYLFVQLSNCEVEPYWDIANFIRTEIAGESDKSRDYTFTRDLIARVRVGGVEGGLIFAAANPQRSAREGVIDTYAFRAWHEGDVVGAENLLRFNLRRNPESLPGLWSMAEFYRLARRNAEAVAAYRAFLQRQPGDADALAYVANLGG